MDKLDFMRWCAAAVEEIRYKPDRERVYDELYAHLEDRCAVMTEAGVPEREAVKRTLEAMGSATEAAEQLGKIHRPFWGCVLSAARWLLLFAAVLALFTVPRWLRTQAIISGADPFVDVYFEQSEWERDGIRGERVFYAEPMSRDFSDGSRFTLTKAAEWHETGTLPGGVEANNFEFYLTVEVFALRPWAQDGDILLEFYAVDSLGNRYAPYNRSYYGHAPTLAGNMRRTGYCTQTWKMWLSEYCSHGADWIELRYDRSGRDVRLRIDLTGGEAA